MSDLSKSTCSGLSHIAGETPPSDSSFEQSFMIVNRDAKIATGAELNELRVKKLKSAARHKCNKRRQSYHNSRYSLTATFGDVTLKLPKLSGIFPTL